jgi:uncharacterized protein YcbK (DUF882 family)
MYFSKETDPAIDFSKVNLSILARLEGARTFAGVPFRISSHYRTPEHSVSVGGRSNSAHTKIPCTAFDITYSGGEMLYRIVRGAIHAGFTRIGINPHNLHVHIDCEESLPAPRLWIE